jgi:bifunctional non-homologous end joining protein LigD
MRQEAVVIGFTRPRGSRQHIGSLILAVKEGSGWRYIGHTGGSMGGRPLKEVYDTVQPLITKKKPAQVPREVERNATWVRPSSSSRSNSPNGRPKA